MIRGQGDNLCHPPTIDRFALLGSTQLLLYVGNDLDSSGAASGSHKLDDAIARQERVLDLQLQWIAAVDGKLPIVIGLATAMLAAIGVVAPDPKDIGWWYGVLIAFGSVPLVVCLMFCARSTFPQTIGPVGSMIFFGGIADLPLSQYCEKVEARTRAEHLNDLCRQAHRNAQLAAMKFASVQMAMKWLYGGTASWLVAGYLLYKG
jgi:hypothetical protein